jgi:CRP/FNR family transcriptional regulator, cyclic AMP receptor protein
MDAREARLAPLFEGLDKRALEKVALLAESLDVATGKQIVTEGKLAWDLFVIESGSADVTQDGQLIRQLGAGDFFGEVGLLGGSERRTATVTATSPVRMIVLSAGRLATIEREMPGVAGRVRAALDERMSSDSAAG